MTLYCYRKQLKYDRQTAQLNKTPIGHIFSSMPFLFDNSYSRLPDAFFSLIEPTPVSAPVMIRLNHDLATELGIDIARLDSPHGLAILAGNHRPDGSQPLAMAYSGHQFGGFSPQLGDGRANSLMPTAVRDSNRCARVW